MSQPELPVHVVARHFARPETVADVRAMLTSLIGPSRAEPGCLKYELYQNLADPTDFTFVETFASDAALDAHASAPYITGLQPRLAALIARASDVRRYRAVTVQMPRGSERSEPRSADQ